MGERKEPGRRRGTSGWGVFLVVAAGLGLLVSVFLPWTSLFAEYVDGARGERGTQHFTGWELMVDCRSREFPSQCVVEDRSVSPEFIPDHVVAGDWALVAGSGLATVGVALALVRTRRVETAALVAGWVLTGASFAGAIVTVITLMVDPNSSPPPVEYGVVLACASPAVAVIGLTLVTVRRGVDHDEVAADVRG